MAIPDASVAVKTLFDPRNITVIGASSSLNKWGNVIPRNIIGGGYKGRLYLVNPRGGEVHGLPVYPRAEDIPEPLDLVMMAVPAERVEGALEDCARAGAKTVIVIAGGFSESDVAGKKMEERMVRRAHQLGLRIVGPNTMGIYSAPHSLVALMPAVHPLPGKIAFAAQSGNLGTQMLGWGSHKGVGFSRFVCIGNESDLDFVDYLEYFAQDHLTEVILLYVEGFKDPRRFFLAARDIAREKPIVIYKAGGTMAGNRAASSHSAAMAGDQEIYEGMIRQLGMTRATTTEEMLDFSDALVKMPLPKGNRLAVLTWGGGWGVVTADLCERAGLDVSPLPASVKTRLNEILPSYWSKGNPIDLVGVIDINRHIESLKILAACEEYDAIISLGTINANLSFLDMINSELYPLKEEEKKRMTEVLDEVASRFIQTAVDMMDVYGTPIVAVGMPQREEEYQRLPRGHEKLCIYPNPERAVRVMSILAQRSRFLQGKQSQD